MSIEEGNSKWSNFHKMGANRLCTYVFRLCIVYVHFFFVCVQPPPLQRGLERLLMEELQNGPISMKTVPIVCVHFFFRLCATPSYAKDTGTSIEKGYFFPSNCPIWKIKTKYQFFKEF